MTRGRLRGHAISTEAVGRPLRRFIRELEAAGLGRVDFVVFGHTHVPGLAADEEGRVVVNAGSWVEERGLPSCTFVRIRGGEVELAQWSGGSEVTLARRPL